MTRFTRRTICACLGFSLLAATVSTTTAQIDQMRSRYPLHSIYLTPKYLNDITQKFKDPKEFEGLRRNFGVPRAIEALKKFLDAIAPGQLDSTQAVLFLRIDLDPVEPGAGIKRQNDSEGSLSVQAAWDREIVDGIAMYLDQYFSATAVAIKRSEELKEGNLAAGLKAVEDARSNPYVAHFAISHLETAYRQEVSTRKEELSTLASEDATRISEFTVAYDAAHAKVINWAAWSPWKGKGLEALVEWEEKWGDSYLEHRSNRYAPANTGIVCIFREDAGKVAVNPPYTVQTYRGEIVYGAEPPSGLWKPLKVPGLQ